MYRPEEYYIDCLNTQKCTSRIAKEVFQRVCRYNFNVPGFCLIDLGTSSTIKKLRRFMVDLKHQLHLIYNEKFKKNLVYISITSGSQQMTTRFHLEATKATESMLMLGYEPTTVQSELYINDYSKYVYEHNLDTNSFFRKYPSIVKNDLEGLKKYNTNTNRKAENFQIVVMNNSFLPETFNGTHMLGVMHKAKMITSDAAQKRIVNAIAIAVSEQTDHETHYKDQEKFLNSVI